MEIWLLIFASLSLSLLLNFLIRRIFSSSYRSLPPDPNFFPFLGTLKWIRHGLVGLNIYLRSVHRRLGPIITLRITSRPSIFVNDSSLAHQALILNGAVFADRPTPVATSKIISSNQHNISSGAYGPTWRILRRNLTSEILHPSRLRSYSHARRWVLQILVDRFSSYRGEEPIVVVDHLHYAMFALLVLMCFGDKLSEEQIKQVEFVQRRQLTSISRFGILNFWPRYTKWIMRKRWEDFFLMIREQHDVLLPLIRARRKIVEERKKSKVSVEDDKDYVQSYVDTLFDIELPNEERKPNEDEIVSLCSEFLNGGTDTTATALQWILANLVKQPEIQEKLYQEIKTVIGEETEEMAIREEELQKMPYLKAVVLEGLRRHPPGMFVLPHSVTEDTELGGYKVPKKGTINFSVAEIGRDPKIWEEPMKFKPERFLSKKGEETVDFDITGSRGIKMMPFGVGRRICPGIGLAMLHLEYYVANMVRGFEWKEVEGHEVDFAEKFEFTTVMKHPLKARAVPRTRLRV